ncbi:MAG: hypothetical protein AAF717_00255 [Bacteroidota bacterium]
MKRHLITILIAALPFVVAAQQDTLVLGKQFLESYHKYERMAKLTDLQECVALGEQLRELKQRKYKLSGYLAKLYYRMGIGYKEQEQESRILPDKGYATVAMQRQYLLKSKEHFEYLFLNSPEHDEEWAAAGTAGGVIEDLIDALEDSN